MPIKQDADREQYLEGFRRAGLEWASAEAVDKIRGCFDDFARPVY
jgi:hypothetical protein